MASIAAVLGASAAGSRAMTATSGPGFSLMMENLGLGIMMELPCVLVNIQRGSPSTGLPTLPGQSDIMQARWGSHGDYRIAAFSPWSPQEIFDLTIHSFNVADRFRIPVLLMGDEVVGHMVERVVIPEAAEIQIWDRKRANGNPDDIFYPFEPGDDLVPPIAHAGDGYRVHFTGLTHDTLGYPDMSPETHQQLVRRLVDKVEKNAAEIELVDRYQVEDAEILVISYGSTARSARRAVREARDLGIKVGALRLISVWPFPEIAFGALASQVDGFIVAEMNLGQMITEVERRVNKPVSGVNHAGGAMIPPEPILDEIKRMADFG
jgi:2-oxoglutarate ferredoxin oxidoreductase subunit alpha